MRSATLNLPPNASGRFRWVRSNAFEAFSAGVILLNTIVVLVETDHRKSDDVGWVVSDSLFTSLFLAELVLRMLALGHLWPRSPWNIFDLFLVLASMIDVWILPLLKQQFELRLLTMFRVVRLVRMLRILRLLRLLRHSSKLVLLVHALWGALRALGWFMILLVGVLYVMALIITRLTTLDPHLRDNQQVKDWFGTMPRALFTLFQLMTLEGWPDIARETMDESPWLTLFYISFILVTNITLLNTVAGVLTENVLSTSRQDAVRRQEQREQLLEEEREAVGEEVATIDQDGNGMLELEELRAAQASPQQAPHLARFLALAGLSSSDAEEIFRLVDCSDASSVKYKDFVEAVRRARGTIKSKHIVGLRRDIARLSLDLDNVASLVEKVCNSTSALLPALGCSCLSQETTRDTEGADEATRAAVAELRREFFEHLRGMEARIPSLLQLDTAQANACC